MPQISRIAAALRRHLDLRVGAQYHERSKVERIHYAREMPREPDDLQRAYWARCNEYDRIVYLQHQARRHPEMDAIAAWAVEYGHMMMALQLAHLATQAQALVLGITQAQAQARQDGDPTRWAQLQGLKMVAQARARRRAAAADAYTRMMRRAVRLAGELVEDTDAND